VQVPGAERGGTRGRSGGQAIVADGAGAVELRQRPFQAGLGGFEGLRGAVLVGGDALLEHEVAVHEHGGQHHREEQQHRHDERRSAALAVCRQAGGVLAHGGR